MNHSMIDYNENDKFKMSSPENNQKDEDELSKIDVIIKNKQ